MVLAGSVWFVAVAGRAFEPLSWIPIGVLGRRQEAVDSW